MIAIQRNLGRGVLKRGLLSSALVTGCPVISLFVPMTVLAAQQPATSSAAIQPDAAQQPSPNQIDSEQPAGNGEILVTAQRVAQKLRDVPVAVTAFSGEQLIRAGISDVNNLAGIAPNFQLRDAGTSRQFNIRGSVSTNFNPAPESPVAVYTDDIYHGVPAAQLGEYYDVERVEVLRGPQGTLFGRNSTGGLVQIISRAPTATPQGYLIGTIGSYGSVAVEGAVSGALTDKLTGRVAFKVDRNDGWQKNALVGGPNFNAKDHISGRVYLVYKPSSDFTASLIGSLERQRDRTQGFSALGTIDPASVAAATVNGVVNPNLLYGCSSHDRIFAGNCLLNNGGAATSPSTYVSSKATNDWKSIYSTAKGLPNNLDIGNVALKLAWQIANDTELQSITTYEHVKQDREEDDNATGFLSREIGYAHQLIVSNQFTQELILRQKLSMVNLQGGVYYLHSHRKQILGTDYGDGVPFSYPDEPTLKVDSIAAFAQADFDISPRFKAILGGRYTHDAKRIDYKGTDFSDPVTTPAQFSRSDGVGRPTGRAVLEYHPAAKVMVYASAATGFSAAEYKLNYYGDISSQRLAKPETNTTYELGAKASLWDGRADVDIAIFHSLTKNKQGSQLIPDPRNANASITDFGNYGDVRAQGVEFDATVRPVKQLTLGLNGAYDDTRLNSTLVLHRNYDSTSFALNGKHMVATPKWSFYGYARATTPAGGGGEFSVQGSYRWQSQVFWNLSNDPLETEKPYGIARFEIGWTSAENTYEVAAFVDNAFDRKYSNLHAYFSTSDVDTYQWGTPRWFGVRLRRNF